MIHFEAIPPLEPQLSPGRIALCPSLDLLGLAVVLPVFGLVVPGFLFRQNGLQNRYAHDHSGLLPWGYSGGSGEGELHVLEHLTQGLKCVC